MRAEYWLRLRINGRVVSRVLIDPHYREKRFDLDDGMILEMLKSLDGRDISVDARRGEFEYLRVEPVFLRGKPYRLVLTLSVSDNFLGVINAFRVDRRSGE